MSLEDFRGVWPSEHAYIAAQIAEHLPPWLAWLLTCCDTDRLREGYEAGKLRIWSVPIEGGVRVFESVLELPSAPE